MALTYPPIRSTPYLFVYGCLGPNATVGNTRQWGIGYQSTQPGTATLDFTVGETFVLDTMAYSLGAQGTGATATLTVTVRKNGATTTLTFQITSASALTGVFNFSTPVVWNVGDTIGLQSIGANWGSDISRMFVCLGGH